ncbi:hypothetical protein HQ531_10870 [bacterium]|nr:hypothetical protein [bacterium]
MSLPSTKISAALSTLLFLVISNCAGLLGPDLKPGITLTEAGDHSGALKHYESIIESGKANAEIYRLAYESAFLAGKRVTAGKYYDEAFKAGFDIDSLKTLAVDLWYGRALKLMGMSDWKEAIKAASQIGHFSPDSDEDKFCRYILAGRKKFDRGAHKGLWDAINDYSKAANCNTSSGLPYFLMGQARYKNNRTDYDSALEDYYQSLEIEPEGFFSEQARADIKKIEAVKKKMNAFWGK